MYAIFTFKQQKMTILEPDFQFIIFRKQKRNKISGENQIINGKTTDSLLHCETPINGRLYIRFRFGTH